MFFGQDAQALFLLGLVGLIVAGAAAVFFAPLIWQRLRGRFQKRRR